VLEIEHLAVHHAIAGMVAQCSGWLSSSVSFGRTSMPRVSVQMVAISFSAIQAQVANATPGAGPPAYVPHSPRGALLHLAGANDTEVAALHLDALRLGGAVQIRHSDRVTVGEERGALGRAPRAAVYARRDEWASQ
jgi:hypothetical protein